MLFVELGREVSPLNLNMRKHKAVITGIKDNKFVVILKQDRTHEVIRLKDIVLNDKVYDLESIEKSDFFKVEKEEKKYNDFERFKVNLAFKVGEEVLKSKF